MDTTSIGSIYISNSTDNASLLTYSNGTIANGKLSSQSEVKMFPLLHSEWERKPEAHFGVHIFIGLVALIIGTAGLIGNCIVFCLFIRHKSLRRSAYLFVLNLAAGDTLLILTNVPVLVVSSFHGRWIGGVPGCRLFAFMGGISGFVSINTLTILAIERCVVIIYHLPNTNRISKRGVVILCGCIWGYSFMWSIPPYFGWGGHMMEGSRTSCTFDYFTRTVNNRTYVLCILVFCFALQLIVIATAYFRILYEVFSHRKEFVHSDKYYDDAKCLRVVSSVKKQNIEWRTTKAVFCLIVVFCMSWMPYAIVSIIGQFGDSSLISPLSSALPGLFAKMSSFLNPLVYTLLHSKYRKMVSKCCVKTKNNDFRKRLTSCTMKTEFEKHSSSSSTDCKHFKVILSVNSLQTRNTQV